MPNLDEEDDVSAERRDLIRRLFKEHGQNTRLILTIARCTGQGELTVASVWKEQGEAIQKALHETGKMYG